MKEQSQLDDMRAAVRGDLERARARREADPWRDPEDSQPDLLDGVLDQMETEPELDEEAESETMPAEPSASPQAAADPEPEPEPGDVGATVEAEPPQGFFRSLFTRG